VLICFAEFALVVLLFAQVYHPVYDGMVGVVVELVSLVALLGLPGLVGVMLSWLQRLLHRRHLGCLYEYWFVKVLCVQMKAATRKKSLFLRSDF